VSTDAAPSHPLLVVIGAGPGVGLATARRFAAAGYDIGLIGRTPSRLQSLSDELSAEGAQVGFAAADAADPDSLTAALRALTDHTGRLDVLLHNLAAFRPGPPSSLTAADLLADLGVGAASLLTAVRAVLPLLRTQHTGTVLVTGSGAADRPFAPAASLGPQKAALRNLVQALADELRPEGIHVATVTVYGTIAPGTPFAPDVIAGLYADLVAQTTDDPSTWQTVIELREPHR
jgi:NAD(P)-dependent dehydrogenase (short-subunit alcohol dehydrogenase family)